ncbi:hypothetical protein [Labrys monachus]|uniref:Uncharacterized protein n=1 Tax=Labrys monachus TaxID=217067 RepID=A0ABU0FGD1_9HYPH|nr:hypothetical protein [Labrys monachus]MDQ0393658.1 hypothetical protein [Labrys monachus]
MTAAAPRRAKDHDDIASAPAKTERKCSRSASVPVKHGINPCLPLLDIDGTLVLVGQIGTAGRSLRFVIDMASPPA